MAVSVRDRSAPGSAANKWQNLNGKPFSASPSSYSGTDKLDYDDVVRLILI